MIRAILSDAAELTGLGLFLAALAMILAPCDAQALTPEAADRGAYWFAGVLVFCAIIAAGIAAAVRAIGCDAAAHDNNMHAAERAESITGGEK